MKIIQKLTLSISLAIILIFSMTLSINAAQTALLTWDLVDSGKHLDYDGNSKYMSNVNYGADKWNGYKAGVIRKDSAIVIEDVYVYDYYKVESYAAWTSPQDSTIRFNDYFFPGFSSTKRNNAASHELGHALGLAHHTLSSANIMYQYVSNVNYLGTIDKASYDEAYNEY